MSGLRILAGLSSGEIPLLRAIGVKSSPTIDHIVPASPHPTYVLCLKEIFAVPVEQLPIRLLGWYASDNLFAIWRPQILVTRPAGLTKRLNR